MYRKILVNKNQVAALFRIMARHWTSYKPLPEPVMALFSLCIDASYRVVYKEISERIPWKMTRVAAIQLYV